MNTQTGLAPSSLPVHLMSVDLCSTPYTAHVRMSRGCGLCLILSVLCSTAEIDLLTVAKVGFVVIYKKGSVDFLRNSGLF